MNAAPIASGAAHAAVQSAEPQRAQLREAAQQFEAILLRQLLASARTTSFGGGDLLGQSDATFREMRDAHFAMIASSSGQIGFAAAVERQLADRLPKGPK